MNFPLTLSFKKIALAPQITVTDAQGQMLFYVKQKLFKLKEAVTVFADKEQTRPLYTMGADRVIDFSPRFFFKDMQGNDLGSVKRHGARSIWKTHYDIMDGEQVVGSIKEENAWVKVMDGIFGEIPLIGILSGYVFNPVYLVNRPDESVVVKIKKQPAFLESSFTIEEAIDINEAAELRTILSIIMMTLMERSRG
ncbi:MAG: hypothetical protein QNJ45_26925 [Ardenticatenaceae bacterium]|nr:hypothetical protein [Ardenticatenaceae bacterium]